MPHTNLYLFQNICLFEPAFQSSFNLPCQLGANVVSRAVHKSVVMNKNVEMRLVFDTPVDGLVNGESGIKVIKHSITIVSRYYFPYKDNYMYVILNECNERGSNLLFSLVFWR